MDCVENNKIMRWSRFVDANVRGSIISGCDRKNDYVVDVEKFKTSKILRNLYV